MKNTVNLIIFILFFIIGIVTTQAADYETVSKLSIKELYESGNQQLERNRTDSALIYFITLSGKYQLSLSQQDKLNTIEGFIKVGNIYYEQSSYHNAYDFYFKAFSICDTEGIKELLPELYKNIGNVYIKFEDFEHSRNYYLKGLELAKELNDVETEWKLLTNLLAVSCEVFGDTDQAWYYYYQLEKLNMADKKLKKYYSLLDVGYIYKYENKLDSAIYYYTKTLNYAEKDHLEPRYISSPAFELGYLYETLGNFNKALKYYLYSYEINQKNNLTDLRINSLYNLSIFYKKINDQIQSDNYLNQYYSLSDSVFNIREFNRVKNLQMVYDMNKVNEQMKILDTEKKESELKLSIQQKITLGISIGLFLFILLLIVVLIQNRRLKGAYVDLFERNREILKSEKEARLIRKEYAKKLQEEKEKKAALLPVIIPEVTAPLLEVENEVDNLLEEDAAKVSNLTEEQQEKLTADILQVMENTLEFCDSEFNLNRLASLINSNTKYVSHIINDVFHKNFRSYINEYRIKEACKRLMNIDEYGQYTIKAIAESVGYKSHTTFISTFKQYTGINPSTYQKIAQQKKEENLTI